VPVRAEPTILHLDLDAFYAAVEQRDKPSLRGRPVVVGGVGGRGVVATASYEARAYGVRSAMSTREARARCPHAAYLSGRFDAYRAASALVMEQLRRLSPLVEPLSLDEAFVDLAAGDALAGTADVATVTAVAERLKADVHEVTEGLTASVGIGSSKLIAKIASDLRKPDGLVVVAPGTERDLLRPMPITTIPGVGPATAERLRRLGVHTVADAERMAVDELVALLGRAHGEGLYRLVRADDDRPVVAEREAKSISVEDTFDSDVVEQRMVDALVERQATKVVGRLRAAGLAGRTVTVKVRLHDFSTLSRSTTLPAPTDDVRTVVALARTLVHEVDTAGGVRLLGVGISGLADWIQEDLFGALSATGDPGTGSADPAVDAPADGDPAAAPTTEDAADIEAFTVARPWPPGADVHHVDHGDGWVWGAGLGRVTVRFETRRTGPGPVRTFASDDPGLSRGHRAEGGASDPPPASG